MFLLLHGALGSKTQLEPIRTALGNAGHEAFTMNFSGHSGVPFSKDGFGIDVFADDVNRFMDENRLKKVDVFGFSMGGYVALWFAYRFPEKIGRIITLGTKFDWDMVTAEKEVAKLDPDKILKKVPAFARILENRHAPNDWRDVIRRTGDMMRELGKQPLLTETILSQLTHEIQIWLGDRDDMADRAYSERVASILPRGNFRLLPDTTHPIEKLKVIPFLS